MLSSTVLRALWKPLLIITLAMLFICVYDTARTVLWSSSPDHVPPHVQAQLLPAWFPCIIASAHIPFLLASPALSLLLVFRTNASYARYAEARAKFGGLTRRCRDLVRQGLQWYAPADRPLLAQLVRLNAALPRVLLWSCRSGRDLRKDLRRQNVLHKAELDAVCSGEHPVTTLMTLMTMAIAAARITPMQRAVMDRNMTHLIDCMGDCEAMLQTPIPSAYTRYAQNTAGVSLPTGRPTGTRVAFCACGCFWCPSCFGNRVGGWGCPPALRWRLRFSVSKRLG